MKFYKFRTQWSSSPGTWEIVRLPEGETPKSYFGEMGREYDYSEHFRGIEFRKLKVPPKEWLEKEISNLTANARGLIRLSEVYQKLLDTI